MSKSIYKYLIYIDEFSTDVTFFIKNDLFISFTSIQRTCIILSSNDRNLYLFPQQDTFISVWKKALASLLSPVLVQLQSTDLSTSYKLHINSNNFPAPQMIFLSKAINGDNKPECSQSMVQTVFQATPYIKSILTCQPTKARTLQSM